ncbi:MAG: trypsin-like peptidase domain-containing protein [Leptospiraceae bacterium]|nr:trypsin-like peptidase domain-containing protein [Leptospiraceae bacterium]MCP5500007.1 trypsin-like peptidase domain-containing protein [Leptospiraceae bacterium]
MILFWKRKLSKTPVFLLFLLLCLLNLNLSAQNRNVSDAKNAAIELENVFQKIYEDVSPSVVSIATERMVKVQTHPFMNDPFFEHFFGQGRVHKGRQLPHEEKQTGLGSGIILSSDGYILTNEHVIHKMDKLTVKLKNGKTYSAKVAGSDTVMDLAVLKIETKNLPPVKLGDSSAVKVGSWAIAIGAPLGFEQSLTVGIISAVARRGIDSSGLSYIQSDTAINKGNSGGPLLNIHGEVIGINRMIASQSGGSVGIGFTIPINEAREVFTELKKNGKIKRAWIGIGLDSVSDTEEKELGLQSKKGAIVRQVMPNSPAEKSGIKNMDVIVKAGDREIESPQELVQEVRKSKIGKHLKLELIRKKRKIRLLIKPEARPD